MSKEKDTADRKDAAIDYIYLKGMSKDSAITTSNQANNTDMAENVYKQIQMAASDGRYKCNCLVPSAKKDQVLRRLTDLGFTTSVVITQDPALTQITVSW